MTPEHREIYDKILSALDALEKVHKDVLGQAERLSGHVKTISEHIVILEGLLPDEYFEIEAPAPKIDPKSLNGSPQPPSPSQPVCAQGDPSPIAPDVEKEEEEEGPQSPPEPKEGKKSSPHFDPMFTDRPWPEILNRARAILAHAGEPLPIGDLFSLLTEEGVRIDGKTPTMNLRVNMKKDGGFMPFKGRGWMVRPGAFGKKV